MKKIIFILLAIPCVGKHAMGQEKIDTDRPDQTESAFTVPKHWLQFEAGFSKQQNNGREKEYQLPGVLTKYGISNKIELRLITTFQSTVFNEGSTKSSLNGFAPVEVGAKIGLWEEKKLLPKTSLIFHVGIPWLAAKKFRPDNTPVNFRFTMQHTISDKVSLGYNAGAEWDGESNTAIWVYTFTTGYSFAEKWYSYVEAFGSVIKKDVPQHNIDGGIAYTIGNDIKVDLSSGFGISKAAPDWYVAAGFSMRIKMQR